MWKNVVERGRPQMAHVHCMLDTQGYKYTHTHTHRLCKLVAFPQQQWLHERASMLRYTYIACLFMNWQYVVSEDGKHVPQHVGEAHLMFVLIKNAHLVGIIIVVR